MWEGNGLHTQHTLAGLERRALVHTQGGKEAIVLTHGTSIPLWRRLSYMVGYL